MNKKIYILHGWAYSTEKWKPFLDILKKQGVSVELLQIPGLTAPLKEIWHVENYVAWLNGIVKNDSVILFGHSNGGRISLAFALKYPEKVERLFLIDSANIYHNELPIKVKRIVFGMIAKIGKKLTQSKKLRVLLYKFARVHDYEKADPIVRQTMTNLIHTDQRENLPNLAVPTTIIWGENDKITPVEDGKILKKEIPNASLHIISGARHSPQFTHAEEVAEIVLKKIHL